MTLRVIDLFSGAGGMSLGFHRHADFSIVGAADAEVGKPSTGFGALGCNRTYELNIGIAPLRVDLGSVVPEELAERFGATRVDVLIACAPCTGFSRTNSNNHLRDDPRNSLVARVAEFVRFFRPQVVLMENARELITGNFRNHLRALTGALEEMGYQVDARSHYLSSFGVPQARERALVVAVRKPVRLRSLEDLWDGYSLVSAATTVRRAIADLPPLTAGETSATDPAHTSTASDGLMLKRLRATPHDGGSWLDWQAAPDADELLIPSMKRSIKAGTTNHFCDVYGRMFWDKPAPTIKRECSHIGNGRYAHPEQDRLCSVREMAILQGFPKDFQFGGRSRKNMYRAIGDAVPPLVSYQLAQCVSWMLGGQKPLPDHLLLDGCHLAPTDIVVAAPTTFVSSRQAPLFA